MFLKPKQPVSLASSLTMHYLASFALLLAVLFCILYIGIAVYFDGKLDEDLEEDAQEYRQLFQQEGKAELLYFLKRDANPADNAHEFVRVFDLSGTQLFHSDLQAWQGLEFSLAIHQTPHRLNDEVLLESQYLPLQDSPVRVAYAMLDAQHVIQIGESAEDNEALMMLLAGSFIGMYLLSLPAIAFTGRLVASGVAGKIREVSETAVHIGKGDFNRRVTASMREKELSDLAESFNHMARRVQTLIKEMREMTDNIAHDLRSPIGRIRATAEICLTGACSTKDYQHALESSIQECDRLINLINMTLDVAEAEAGIISSDIQSFNLSMVFEDVIELFEASAEQKHIQFETSISSNLSFHGNKTSIERMVANLLDNAIKYTPEHGQIKLELIKSNGDMRMTVSDTGSGIPFDEQNRVFERFFRSDQSRSKAGSGLGLSYSRAVARAHGGDITLTSLPNQHTIFTVLLPTT